MRLALASLLATARALAPSVLVTDGLADVRGGAANRPRWHFYACAAWSLRVSEMRSAAETIARRRRAPSFCGRDDRAALLSARRSEASPAR
mmetsp:Transcript_16247/g.50265  ORF Transcript_16247/g.50265 Transcript_16247/m.50265 type:complete len:91 (+) Transcript_16247:215-487(+)